MEAEIQKNMSRNEVEKNIENRCQNDLKMKPKTLKRGEGPISDAPFSTIFDPKAPEGGPRVHSGGPGLKNEPPGLKK